MVYMSYILAFVIEAVLFYFHLHGRKAMDVQVSWGVTELTHGFVRGDFDQLP